MSTRLDYHTPQAAAPTDVPMPSDVRAVVGRAGWSVIQTGLITTGLALFGVFVLANRIADSRVMGLYVLTWIPAGPILVGIIAGSGYLLAAWWHGVGVGARMLAAILMLQVGAYFAAQYAEFQTLNLYNRETREPARFGEYFRYTTETWRPQASDDVDPRDVPTLGKWGYALRGGEAMLFALGGAGAALALVGKPRCRLCRSQLRWRNIGRIPASDSPRTIERLQEFSRTGNLRAFKTLVAGIERHEGQTGATGSPQPENISRDSMELVLTSCAVCGFGYLEPARGASDQNHAGDATNNGRAPERVDLDSRFTAVLVAGPKSKP